MRDEGPIQGEADVMNERYVEYFIDVSESLSITESAERLYLTPQGLSKAIRSLEEELGVALLIRSGKRLALTDAAKEMIPHFYKLIDITNEIAGHAKNHAMRIPEQERLTIYITPFISKYLSPHFDSIFGAGAAEKYAFREVSLIGAEKMMLRDMPSHHFCIISFPKTDYYCTLLASMIEKGSLRFQPLAETDLMVALSNSSLLASRPSLSLQELKSMPVACYADRALLDFLELHIDRRSFSYVGNDSSVVFRRVASNDAVTFIPSIARLKRLPEGICLRDIKDTMITKIGIIEASGQSCSAEKEEALELIRCFFTANSKIGCFRVDPDVHCTRDDVDTQAI